MDGDRRKEHVELRNKVERLLEERGGDKEKEE